MTKTRNQGDGAGDPASLPSGPSQEADSVGNNPLIDQARQIIEATPEIRPEKVAPLQEAVEQGTYEVDTRKLANALITKLLLDP